MKTSGFSFRVIHQIQGRVRFGYSNKSDPLLLEQAALGLEGVIKARVNPLASSLIIYFKPDLTSQERLWTELEKLAISARNKPPRLLKPEIPDKNELSEKLIILILGRFLPLSWQLSLGLWGAFPIIRHALRDYRKEGVNSHVLEGMAVAISLARGDYNAANTTSFMLALGEYIEDSIARRSDDLLKHLLRPNSDEVWKLKDGQEVLVPTSSLQVGDTIIVATGNIIPIDGTVLSGEASVNEAAMTGESLALPKSRGNRVLSGTLLEEGRLVIYAQHVGENTAAARIAQYVEQSLQGKSQAQLEAAKLADRLVPGVLRLASASYLFSGDWRRAASVLQADYSCALKLATPVAFKAAMFAAGKAGILVKGATALEALAAADTFIFDKTGTLTTGRLVVTEAIVFDSSYSPDDLICLAASVEEHYFHPLAQAVVEAAKATHNRHFDHQEVEFIVAHGVASVIDGQRIVVGSRHFIEEDEGIDTNFCQAQIARLYQQGKTLLFIGFGGKLLGILALKDSIRANSRNTIAQLRQLGVARIILLTGDHQDRAAELAQELGLDDFRAQLLPEDKARIIRELSEQGAKIAFVGDGINDAPALAGALVGVAMQKGADIARLTADVALLEDDIAKVAQARAIALATLKRIGHNYNLTLGLNTAILGGAALGALSPIATSVLHNGTTIGILLNALRRIRGSTNKS